MRRYLNFLLYNQNQRIILIFRELYFRLSVVVRKLTSTEWGEKGKEGKELSSTVRRKIEKGKVRIWVWKRGTGRGEKGRTRRRKFSFTFYRWCVTHWWLCCIISFLVHEHVACVKSCCIVSVVALKSYAKELSVALHVELLLLAAVPRVLPVPGHVIRKFDEVARRYRLAAVTSTSFLCQRWISFSIFSFKWEKHW